MRFEIVARKKLDRMGGDRRQIEPVRERDRLLRACLDIRVTGALQLEIIAIGKMLPPPARMRLRLLRVAECEGLPDVAQRPAGQRDQSAGIAGEPFARDLCPATILVAAIGARQPVAQLEVPSARLAQEQRPERLVAIGVVGEPQVAADDRLHAFAPRRLIELHQPEQVVEVGERERRHAVRDRRSDSVVEPDHAIDDGILAVQSQMDEGRCRAHEVQF